MWYLPSAVNFPIVLYYNIKIAHNDLRLLMDIYWMNGNLQTCIYDSSMPCIIRYTHQLNSAQIVDE